MLSVQLYINDSPVAVFCLPASADNPGERQKKHQPLPLPPATYGLTARHEPRLSGKIYLLSAALPASLPVPDEYRLPLLSAVTDDSDSPKQQMPQGSTRRFSATSKEAKTLSHTSLCGETEGEIKAYSRFRSGLVIRDCWLFIISSACSGK